jgi:hypothetical protein
MKAIDSMMVKLVMLIVAAARNIPDSLGNRGSDAVSELHGSRDAQVTMKQHGVTNVLSNMFVAVRAGHHRDAIPVKDPTRGEQHFLYNATGSRG